MWSGSCSHSLHHIPLHLGPEWQGQMSTLGNIHTQNVGYHCIGPLDTRCNICKKKKKTKTNFIHKNPEQRNERNTTFMFMRFLRPKFLRLVAVQRAISCVPPLTVALIRGGCVNASGIGVTVVKT